PFWEIAKRSATSGVVAVQTCAGPTLRLTSFRRYEPLVAIGTSIVARPDELSALTRTRPLGSTRTTLIGRAPPSVSATNERAPVPDATFSVDVRVCVAVNELVPLDVWPGPDAGALVDVAVSRQMRSR